MTVIIGVQVEAHPHPVGRDIHIRLVQCQARFPGIRVKHGNFLPLNKEGQRCPLESQLRYDSSNCDLVEEPGGELHELLLSSVQEWKYHVPNAIADPNLPGLFTSCVWPVFGLLFYILDLRRYSLNLGLLWFSHFLNFISALQDVPI